MRTSFHRSVLMAIALLVTSAWPIQAQQFQPGDVILTASSPMGAFSDFTCKLLWYDGNGNLKGVLLAPPLNQSLGGAAFSPSGVLHVLTGAGISQVAANGSATPFYDAFSQGNPRLPNSTSFAADGSIYNGAGCSGGVCASIIHVSSAGVRVALYDVPVLPQAVDLGSDQCTLYYLTLNTLSRFDVCHGTALANLATFPGGGVTAYDFRILPDHTLLVGLSGHLAQLNTAGQTLRQFGGGVFRMALDTDPRFLWAETSSGKFSKLDLASGNTVLGPFDSGMQSITSMTVFGEPRAALINGPLAAIPALSPLFLLLFGAVLLSVGLLRVR
jgi:hypothetical protein